MNKRLSLLVTAILMANIALAEDFQNVAIENGENTHSPTMTAADTIVHVTDNTQIAPSKPVTLGSGSVLAYSFVPATTAQDTAQVAGQGAPGQEPKPLDSVIELSADQNILTEGNQYSVRPGYQDHVFALLDFDTKTPDHIQEHIINLYAQKFENEYKIPLIILWTKSDNPKPAGQDVGPTFVQFIKNGELYADNVKMSKNGQPVSIFNVMDSKFFMPDLVSRYQEGTSFQSQAVVPVSANPASLDR